MCWELGGGGGAGGWGGVSRGGCVCCGGGGGGGGRGGGGGDTGQYVAMYSVHWYRVSEEGHIWGGGGILASMSPCPPNLGTWGVRSAARTTHGETTLVEQLAGQQLTNLHITTDSVDQCHTPAIYPIIQLTHRKHQ